MTISTFGRGLRSQFLLEPEYIPLNHASFGSYPRFILQLRVDYQSRVNQYPNRWDHPEVISLLQDSRKRIANFIHCKDPKDIALVPIAVSGVTTVLQEFPFDRRDKVIYFSTTSTSTSHFLKHLERRGQIELIEIDLHYPTSNAMIIKALRMTIESHIQKGSKVCMVVIDAFISQPGVRFPFEAAVSLVKKYGILSLVDGTHALGQIPINMESLDPDFFVSDLHNWLYLPRASLVIYVSKRAQNHIHGFPFICCHDMQRKPMVLDFEMMDYSMFLCVGAALKFRKALGGEKAIQRYCHTLAIQGGALVAKVLGTEVMENDEETLIANMVNVRLPLASDILNEAEMESEFAHKMVYERHCLVSGFKHNNAWWVRLSAQIYNDLDDFRGAAKALSAVCRDLSE
ncbi:pyridoxal phosphate-dependent transferase [Fennellomyces sp. T-0311]|nr:pyridoxal phosphate-dependent transferase [Fennellomyces sp. T-0311]